jgi:hypothetical protein
MLKRTLYEKLKDKLGAYVDGIDERQLDIGFFGGRVDLKDLILRPDAINKKLEHKNQPFQLKAGLIKKASFTVSDLYLTVKSTPR